MQAWACLGQALKEGWLGGVADCASLRFNPTTLLRLLHAHATEQPGRLHTRSMVSEEKTEAQGDAHSAETTCPACSQPAASSFPPVELVY